MEHSEQTKWQDDERGIDLVQFLVDILINIRLIIICACVFALLLGGWKLASGWRDLRRQEQTAIESEEEQLQIAAEMTEHSAAEMQKEAEAAYNEALLQYEKDLEKYENAMKIYQLQRTSYEEQLEQTLDAIAKNEAYRKGSVLLNIGAGEACRKGGVWYVDTHYQVNANLTLQSPDRVASVVTAYEAVMTGGELYAYVREHITDQLDVRYLRELISIEADSSSALIHIEVTGNSPQMASEMYSAVGEYLEEHHAQIASVVHQHDLTLIEEWEYGSSAVEAGSTGVGSNTEDIISAQDEFHDQLMTLQKTATDLQLKILGLEEPEKPAEIQAVQITQNTQTNQDTTDQEPTELISRSSVVSSGIKNALYGILLGATLSVAYLLYRFLKKDAALNENQIHKRYGLFILSSLRRFQGVSRWQRMLSRLSGDKERVDSIEEAAALAKVNIASLLEAAGCSDQNVLFVGRKEEKVSAMVDLIGKQGPKGSHVIASYGGDVMKNETAVERLLNYENVVLVESKEETAYRDIRHETEKLVLLKKNVVGIIAL